MNLKKVLVYLSCFVCLATICAAQAPFALMPDPRYCPPDQNGAALSGGFVYTFIAGTSTPLATFTDSSGAIQNANPVLLDSTGCAQIWLSPSVYDIAVADMNNAQQYKVFNVSNPGQILYNKALLLAPLNGLIQTITGPIAATYFQGTTLHTTSPGVRVNLIDPNSTLDTATNPPTLTTTNPANAAQNYTIPDPGNPQSAFILSPGQTGNVLDCTATGLTCKRTAYVYMEGGGCNNSTSALGWDTFGTQGVFSACITGTNIQKGVLALPGAATLMQQNTGTGSAATTVTTTYPAATVAGALLEAEVAVDGAKTVSGCTDGTNAYTKAVSKVNGNLDLEIWYFNGSSTSMAASTTLTCTLSAAANAAINWKAYSGLTVPIALDVTANNSGTGTAVTTGATAGTAQSSNLVLAAVGALTNPSVAFASGWTGHTTVSQSTNVTVSSEGLIQQVAGTESGSFTLGSSQVWASVVAVFKVNTGYNGAAQRSIALPNFFSSTAPINATIKWQAPQLITGSQNVALAAQVVCTSDGNSDDPGFNTAVTAVTAVNPSAANIMTSTALNSLPASGCASGNLLHLQILRVRTNPADTYEGWVYVSGVSLQFGITQ
jgi:hypothetical protein